MRRQTPIAHLLYTHLFPHPTQNDPPSFSAHLARNLVPEVRIEVATFYGDLNSVEARYPGLNYCYGPHRMRLGRFKHHKRLFDAFDALGLTYNEIQDFCCWEGTKWARERYEKDEGVAVLDTTGDCIKPFVDRREIRAAAVTRQTEVSVIVEEAMGVEEDEDHNDNDDEEMSGVLSEADDENDTEGMETASEPPFETEARQQRRLELGRRRHQAIVASERDGPPEVEQFLTERIERDNLRLSPDVRAYINDMCVANGSDPAANAASAAARAATAVASRAAA